MYVAATCPEWFWLFPLIGMVFMLGMVLFLFRAGQRTGFAGKGCCGHTPDSHDPDHAEDKEKTSSQSSQH